MKLRSKPRKRPVAGAVPLAIHVGPQTTRAVSRRGGVVCGVVADVQMDEKQKTLTAPTVSDSARPVMK